MAGFSLTEAVSIQLTLGEDSSALGMYLKCLVIACHDHEEYNDVPGRNLGSIVRDHHSISHNIPL